jgi:hypothetical protein
MKSTMRVVPLLLAVLFVAGVHGHGWLSFPESRNSRLNQVAPEGQPGLRYNRMNGNGRAGYLAETPSVISQPGEHDNVVPQLMVSCKLLTTGDQSHTPRRSRSQQMLVDCFCMQGVKYSSAATKLALRMLLAAAVSQLLTMLLGAALPLPAND